jgi:hypothetical protein
MSWWEGEIEDFLFNFCRADPSSIPKQPPVLRLGESNRNQGRLFAPEQEFS